MNEKLENLVNLARNKKAGEFKTALHAEISDRMSSKIADMKSVLSKTMFASKKVVKEDADKKNPGEAPSPSSVEHTHDDGTTHSHVGGDEKHTHESVEHTHEDGTKHSHVGGDETHVHEDVQEAKSGGKEAYQKYFNSVLAKYKVKSADELSGEQKKKFYDEIDAGWEGDNEED